jgi:hypothetical protein
MKPRLAIAAALAAVAAFPAGAATPARISLNCTFEDGVALVLDPAKRSLEILDAKSEANSFGGRQMSADAKFVASLTAQRVSYVRCRRVAVRRTVPRTTHLAGPWPARVFSRVLCGIGGPGLRLDLTRLAGGGYRLVVALPTRTGGRAYAAVELRPRNRGGIWFDIPGCERLIS